MISQFWTGLVVLTISVPTNALIASPPQALKPHKLTFKELKHIIAFGDSFTDVGYSPTISPQPSLNNYEGNPPIPGTSTCYADNYVQILSSEVNRTFVSLYDLAHSGAVVDGDLVSPYESEDNTFVHQVSDKFLPYFSEGRLPRGDGAEQKGKRRWEGSDTLVTTWFGINDVDRAMGGYWPLDPLWEVKAPMMIESLINGLEKVRKEGAENFAILNLPPYWLSPSVQEYQNVTYTNLAKTRTLLWNQELVKQFNKWQRAAHPAVNAKIVDTFTLYLNMTERPHDYGMSQVTTDCAAYIGGPWPAGDLDFWDPSCPAPMKEYLWLDWVHPTFTVHQHVAALVVKTMGL
ncbi:carbohydrate esterase family 16 protein [Xylariaceae sp. AK1471]|nr:carbohydrate esterase family 16 protein [Xylariaceae sp. AK1471]